MSLGQPYHADDFNDFPPAKKQRIQNGKKDLISILKGKVPLHERKKNFFDLQVLQCVQYPLKIVRGTGAYLYDEYGVKYLDATNNVACVGHSHPKVTESCSAQMGLLNTNSRFLNERICTFAKKLCSKFPEELSCCFFTNSGSEANELALMIARAVTGRKHTISITGCYHGHLSSLRALTGHNNIVSTVTLPDVYRGKHHHPKTAGPLYAKEIKNIVESQREKEDEVAVFIHESMLGHAGQIVPPEGYFRDAYKYIHEAGGVVIADEVHTGFGRMGEQFWAFECQGACPDIVTLGTAMGNGHPVSAVITSKKIAQKFSSTGLEYFNTFGGNPVSMAVSEAVLSVVEEENLQEKAKELGSYLLGKLTALRECHSVIGDVRGLGLNIGVDIVKDKDSREPNAHLANLIKSRLFYKHKIILNVTGVSGNVLEIKPPLVVAKEDCDHLLQSLQSALSEE